MARKGCEIAADPQFAATILANEEQDTGIEFKELKNEGADNTDSSKDNCEGNISPKPEAY